MTPPPGDVTVHWQPPEYSSTCKQVKKENKLTGEQNQDIRLVFSHSLKGQFTPKLKRHISFLTELHPPTVCKRPSTHEQEQGCVKLIDYTRQTIVWGPHMPILEIQKTNKMT